MQGLGNTIADVEHGGKRRGGRGRTWQPTLATSRRGLSGRRNASTSTMVMAAIVDDSCAQMSKKILNLPALASQGAGRQAALVPLIGDEIIDMFAMDLGIADRGLLELPKKAQPSAAATSWNNRLEHSLPAVLFRVCWYSALKH